MNWDVGRDMVFLNLLFLTGRGLSHSNATYAVPDPVVGEYTVRGTAVEPSFVLILYICEKQFLGRVIVG